MPDSSTVTLLFTDLVGSTQHLGAAAEAYRRYGFGQRWLDRVEAVRASLS